MPERIELRFTVPPLLRGESSQEAAHALARQALEARMKVILEKRRQQGLTRFLGATAVILGGDTHRGGGYHAVMQAAAGYPPLGVLGLVDALLDRVRSWVVETKERPIARDARIGALERLRDTIVQEARAWCTSVSPDDVPLVLHELGRRHWRLWGATLRFVLDLEEVFAGEEEGILRVSAEAWNDLATRAHEALPMLTPAARRDVRSSARLMAELTGFVLAVERTNPTSITTGEVAALFDLPADRVPIELLQINAALEVIFVAGHMGGIGESVSRAAASWLWSALRTGVQQGSPLGARVVQEARVFAVEAEAPHAANWSKSPQHLAALQKARQELAQGYDALRVDEKAWAEFQRVQAEWDPTIGDGLEGTERA